MCCFALVVAGCIKKRATDSKENKMNIRKKREREAMVHLFIRFAEKKKQIFPFFCFSMVDLHLTDVEFYIPLFSTILRGLHFFIFCFCGSAS